MPVSPGASPFRTQFRTSAMRPSGRGGGSRAYPDGVPLTGLAGSYIRCVDSAALSFSNDIELVIRAKATDWSAGVNQTLAGKYITTGNQRSWRFYVSTVGALGLSVSADGTVSFVTTVVTPSVALVDGQASWLRLRFDLTNGTNSVGSVDSANGTTSDEPSSWTANGTPANGLPVAGVFDSTAPLEIGAFGNGASERFTGTIYRVIVRSGFAGTVVADFDHRLSGLTGYTDAYGNTWVIS